MSFLIELISVLSLFGLGLSIPESLVIAALNLEKLIVTALLLDHAILHSNNDVAVTNS